MARVPETGGWTEVTWSDSSLGCEAVTDESDFEVVIVEGRDTDEESIEILSSYGASFLALPLFFSLESQEPATLTSGVMSPFSAASDLGLGGLVLLD